MYYCVEKGFLADVLFHVNIFVKVYLCVCLRGDQHLLVKVCLHAESAFSLQRERRGWGGGGAQEP